jgi:RNA polymerase sigma-70 factor (ECF subfamily)
LLRDLLPDQAEIIGLLALMLLHESRRSARMNATFDLVPLDEQDRTRWNAEQIAEGCALTEQALRTGRFGSYSLQAAISAVHAEAPTAVATDWPQIVGLYDALLQLDANPVVALNRAVAIAMRDGPAASLPLVNALLQYAPLRTYHLAHAAQADIYHRLGRYEEALPAYRQALALTQQGPEQRYLRQKIAAVEALLFAPGS